MHIIYCRTFGVRSIEYLKVQGSDTTMLNSYPNAGSKKEKLIKKPAFLISF